MDTVFTEKIERNIVIKRFDEVETDCEYIVSSGRALLLIFITGDINCRIQCRVRLAGFGAQAQILGFVTGRGDKICTLSTHQIHEAPHTTSNLLVKSILTEKSCFQYTGFIHVNPIAQKTDAYQRNENLLLSHFAKVQSEPSLEIQANDVRCTHGVTTSTIDKDQLWYLTSRGISERSAQSLITEGFFESALMGIPDIIQREEVRQSIWQIL